MDLVVGDEAVVKEKDLSALFVGDPGGEVGASEDEFFFVTQGVDAGGVLDDLNGLGGEIVAAAGEEPAFAWLRRGKLGTWGWRQSGFDKVGGGKREVELAKDGVFFFEVTEALDFGERVQRGALGVVVLDGARDGG